MAHNIMRRLAVSFSSVGTDSNGDTGDNGRDSLGLNIFNIKKEWKMMNLDQKMSTLHISITTGDDDVRSQSNVYGIAVIQQGQQINSVSKSLNDGANWKNGSTHDADLAIPEVAVRDIQAFKITFSSGQPDPFSTQDNWNMDSILITYRLDDGNEEILLEKADTPVHRFTGSSPVWEEFFHFV